MSLVYVMDNFFWNLFCVWEMVVKKYIHKCVRGRSIKLKNENELKKSDVFTKTAKIMESFSLSWWLLSLSNHSHRKIRTKRRTKMYKNSLIHKKNVLDFSLCHISINLVKKFNFSVKALKSGATLVQNHYPQWKKVCRLRLYMEKTSTFEALKQKWYKNSLKFANESPNVSISDLCGPFSLKNSVRSKEFLVIFECAG